MTNPSASTRYRALAVAGACVAVLGFAGCGGDDDESSTATPEAATGPTGAEGVSSADIPLSQEESIDQLFSTSDVDPESAACYKDYVTERVSQEEFEAFREEGLESGETPPDYQETLSAAEDACGLDTTPTP